MNYDALLDRFLFKSGPGFRVTLYVWLILYCCGGSSFEHVHIWTLTVLHRVK